MPLNSWKVERMGQFFYQFSKFYDVVLLNKIVFVQSKAFSRLRFRCKCSLQKRAYFSQKYKNSFSVNFFFQIFNWNNSMVKKFKQFVNCKLCNLEIYSLVTFEANEYSVLNKLLTPFFRTNWNAKCTQ